MKNIFAKDLQTFCSRFSSKNPSKIVRDAGEALRQIQIEVSQDTQEHMYGADYGHKSEF